VHSKQGHAATHVFETSIGLIPSEGLTDNAGDMGTGVLRIFDDDCTDGFKLLLSENSAAISEFGYVIHEEALISGSMQKAFRCVFDIFHGRKEWIFSGGLP
jgi:hypothetical protein